MLRWTILIVLLLIGSGIVAVGRFGGEIHADAAIVIFLAAAFILLAVLAALPASSSRD
jgi:hypothetical protein